MAGCVGPAAAVVDVVAAAEEEDVTAVVVPVELLTYSSSLLPAPQYCVESPVQTMLQSPRGADADEGARLSPQ